MPGVSVRIRIPGLANLVGRLSPAGQAQWLDPPIRQMLSKMSMATEAAVKERTPRDTVALQRSITSSVDSTIIPKWAKVGTNLKYAEAVEKGSRPHWAPMDALRGWAGRHGIPVVMVWLAIARRGTKANWMFRDGLKAAQSKFQGFADEAGRAISASFR